MKVWIFENRKAMQWLSRCSIRHGLLVLIATTALILSSACQVEISSHPPTNDNAEITPTATIVAETVELVQHLPTHTATPLPSATILPSPTPSPALTAIPLETPPTPWIPAQSPPNQLTIPIISLNTPISFTTWITDVQNGQEISTWQVPDFVAGWHINSALPGHKSNVVLSGHHNIKGEVFRHLVDLKTGDEVILHADGRDYYYAVTDRFILPEKDASSDQKLQNAKWIMPTTDERLTLVTCYPYTNNTHRVIVVAKPSTPQLTANTPNTP